MSAGGSVVAHGGEGTVGVSRRRGGGQTVVVGSIPEQPFVRTDLVGCSKVGVGDRRVRESEDVTW